MWNAEDSILNLIDKERQNFYMKGIKHKTLALTSWPNVTKRKENLYFNVNNAWNLNIQVLTWVSMLYVTFSIRWWM